MLFAMTVLLGYRHSANINRLIQGVEPKLGEKKPTATANGKIKAKKH
jgi:hypothetical protein